MKFTIKDTMPYPLETVFRTQRDRLAELGEYLDGIDAIIVEDHEEVSESVVKFVNLWKAASTDIPKVARAFIKPEMLQWHDYATWDESDWSCKWEMKLGFLPDAIEARGHNTWKSLGDRTLVTINGEIVIHGNKIPGVPRLLAGKVSDAVEKFVVKMIEPNLKKTNEGVTAYIRDHQG